jgi:hypothetical protein
MCKNTTSAEIEAELRKSLEAVRIVRRQTRLICASQGPHELLYFIYMTCVVTFILFLTFAPLLRGATVLPLVIIENTWILVLGMGRVFLKCHYAEKITIEVKDINLFSCKTSGHLFNSVIYRKTTL